MSKERLTSLSEAIRIRDVKLIWKLIREGVKPVHLKVYPELFSYFNEDALFQAIATKDPNIIHAVLKGGAKVTNGAKTQNGERSYFHDTVFRAVNTGSRRILKMVLEAGAKPINDATRYIGGFDDENNTIPQILNLSEELKGVRKNIKKKERRPISKHRQDEMLDLALIYGADPSVLDAQHPRRQELIDRQKYLLRDLAQDTLKKVPKELEETIVVMPRRRVDEIKRAPESLDETIVVQRGEVPKLDNKAKIPLIRNFGPSLYEVIQTKDPIKVKNALDAGSRVMNYETYPSQFGEFNEDSLYAAIKTKNPEIIRMVLKAGAKASNKSTTNDGSRCYYHDTIYQAVKTGIVEIVKIVLEEAGAQVINDAIWPDGELDPMYNTYHQAARSGNQEIKDLVVKYGALNQSASKNKGIMFTPFYLARTELAKTEIAPLVLDKTIKVDPRTKKENDKVSFKYPKEDDPSRALVVEDLDGYGSEISNVELRDVAREDSDDDIFGILSGVPGSKPQAKKGASKRAWGPSQDKDK